jgi:tetratricopeptide (TPR) repeat protein
VLTEKLADLYAAQGKPSSAIDTYQRALKLNPSPQQRIHLRLALGEKLLAQGRTTEAIDDYKKLLEESPAYPVKDSILEKLILLEQKIISANAPTKP